MSNHIIDKILSHAWPFTTPAQVKLYGYKDETNTTVTPLLAGASWTSSSWIYLEDKAQVTITVKSNVAGTLVVKKSSNGITAGETDLYPYTRGGSGMKKGLGAGGIYYKIEYINGAVNQTTFSLHTYVNTTATGFSFQQISDTQLDDAYAQNVLSVMSGKNLFDGSHGVVPLAKDNSLFTTSVPYIFAISEGDIPGHIIQHKMGYTNAASTIETTLWNPGTQYVFPAGTISVEAVSDSANDLAVTGSGARTIHLTYLDINYVEKTFTFNMNGVTPVAGPTDFFRVNSFHVETAGATGKTAGICNLRLVGGAATIYGQMPVGSTRSRNSVFTVSIGKIYYIENVFFSAAYSSSGKSEKMTLHASLSPDGVVSTVGTIFWPYFEAMLVDGVAYDPSDAPLKFPEKTDIKVSVIGETNAKCTSRISGWLE
jgi:hypothetical protein